MLQKSNPIRLLIKSKQLLKTRCPARLFSLVPGIAMANAVCGKVRCGLYSAATPLPPVPQQPLVQAAKALRTGGFRQRGRCVELA